MRRLAQFVRLRASRVSRRSSCLASASRVCVRLASRVGRLVSRASCVCLRLFTSRVSNASCLASVSRLSRVCLASVSHLSRVCVRLSRVCVHLSRVRLRLSRVCLASVVLSRVCVCLASVSRVSVCPCECLRELAHFMRRLSFKEFKKVFAIVILSYNVPMPKYPSHHLIYVFYHPMPIMPLY